MKYNEIYSLVDTGLRDGKTKADIYREFGGTDDIASAIAATPYLVDRQKYAKLNWMLVAVVVYFAVIKLVVSSINWIHLNLPLYYLPLIIFAPAAAIWIAVQLSKFRGVFYLITGLLGLAVVIKGITPESMASLVWSILHLPLVGGVFLAFFLKKRLCPYLGYLGAKTDSDGSYLFLNEKETFNQEDAPDQKAVR